VLAVQCIVKDGGSRQGMIDDHDRCEWVNVSSGTVSPGLPRQSTQSSKTVVVTVVGLKMPTHTPKAMGIKNPKTAPSPGTFGPPSNTPIPRPPQTTARSIYALPHNYATLGCPTFTPKLLLPLRRSLIHPSFTTYHLPNGNQIHIDDLPQYTFRND